MNNNIRRLTQIANKSTRNVIGLMSGTSLDGLDIAYCIITGMGAETKVELRYFKTVDYPKKLKDEIRRIFARRVGDIELLTVLNPWLGTLHGQWIVEALAEWGMTASDVDLVASHGQTIYHAPKINHIQSNYPNATLQVGDGDHIALKTGIITVSDFRQKHIAAGGEGAPLALYGDYLLFSSHLENRLLLNMGGIANFTYLPSSLQTSQVFVTDTGPGNTMLDAWMQQEFDRPFDPDGVFAQQGRVNPALLAALKAHSFFQLSFPKTTGPELFNIDYLLSAQKESNTLFISPYDTLATLTRFSAETICEALHQVQSTNPIDKIYVSGGGANNPVLLSFIQSQVPTLKVERTDSLGIAGDSKEAVLFAVLANEAVAGEPIDFGNRPGLPSVLMGKFSFPR